ncbi:MAG: hypothetical protein R3D63_10095 [Paracoccaceae bacterium]
MRCHGWARYRTGWRRTCGSWRRRNTATNGSPKRFQHGYTQDGTTKVPAFGEVLEPEGGLGDPHLYRDPARGWRAGRQDRLTAIRDELAANVA